MIEGGSVRIRPLIEARRFFPIFVALATTRRSTTLIVQIHLRWR